MKKLTLVAVIMMAAGAFGYTIPGAFPYDGLATYDHMGWPVTPNALHIAGAPTYWTASKAYDVDGEAQEMGGTSTLIAVPIDLGYAINDRILVDLTIQVLMPKFSPDEGDEADATGLGDMWVKGRYIAPVGNGYLGGRLGVKIPLGKVDYEDEDLELGDDQMDIDVAAVGGMYPDAGFALNGQIGFRYRMARKVEYPEPIGEIDYVPGMAIYTLLEPGYSLGKEKAFQFYLPILYEMTMEDKADDEAVDDSSTSGLALGLAPKYTIDANNTVGLKFLYPLMGKNVPQAMNIGVTYEGYIPF